MRVAIKVQGSLLDVMRDDLRRRHAFAHERVGFLTGGVTSMPDGFMILCRDYRAVEDDDYEHDLYVGASIGSDAMRKALRSVYRPSLALLHVHTHGGYGRPGFSGVDLSSARQFMPGFAKSVPRMPHGLLVLSDNSATGLVWHRADAEPLAVTDFIRVGAPLRREWTDR